MIYENYKYFADFFKFIEKNVQVNKSFFKAPALKLHLNIINKNIKRPENRKSYFLQVRSEPIRILELFGRLNLMQ